MTTDENSWTIIQFLDDGTVEAVPSVWIQGDLCHWPSYSQPKMMSAIRKCEPLNTCWPSHKVKIFRNSTFDDYLMARAKAKRAEDTSDLNTDFEIDDKTVRRRRMAKTLSTSEEDSNDDSVLPLPPVPKRTPKKLGESSVLDHESIEKNSLDGSSMSTPEEVVNSAPCKSCEEKDQIFKKIIQQGHMLRGIMTETLLEVKLLRTEIKTMPLVEESSPTFFKTEDINFPIDNEDHFEKLENHLKSEIFFNNAICELRKLGGGNCYDFVRRTLQLIISNDQALKYSWLGRKGKKKFSETNLAKLILISADNGISSTRKETEIAIQTWLRRASDRNHYKSGRVEKKF